MAIDTVARDELERSISTCYRSWSQSYFADYYDSESAYPPVHVEIVKRELGAHRPRTLLDAGCGPASMLRLVSDVGGQRYGFDLTPEMVVEAGRVLGEQGVPAGQVWQGSVLDSAAFRCPADGRDRFDAALCFGVMPHIPPEADAEVLSNLLKAVEPGGLVMVEARNQLFSLFTLNRYTSSFFRDELIDAPALIAAMAACEPRRAGPAESGLPEQRLDAIFHDVERQFRMDLPPQRTGKDNDPGYDEVLSRTHNPFELRQLAERAGFVKVRTLFYHYHAVPPLAERHAPEAVRRASLAMEDPEDWRGHFMASAFILAARRPGP